MRACLLLLAACGRIGFDAQGAGDAGSDAPAAIGFSRLVAYGNVTCASFKGQPYCWGDNSNNQIGDGTFMNRGAPTRVPVPEGPLVGLTVGESHGCAIVGGDLYCWGDFAEEPKRIGFDKPVTDVAAGKRFTCAISAGEATCWGVNDSGQLGDGTFNERQEPTLAIASASAFVAIDAGDDHACALLSSNEALCWGHNDLGTLGTGSFSPTNAENPQTVVNIASLPRIAGWHACALQGTEAWCWGRNSEGALGDGSMVHRPSPQPVPMLDNVSYIATGGGPDDLDATCAIRMGEVYCFGAGTDGRLGNGTTTPVFGPAKVPNLAGTFVEVALGYAHTCALANDGNVFCWGRGDVGQLGNGAKTSSLTPVRVIQPTGS